METMRHIDQTRRVLQKAKCWFMYLNDQVFTYPVGPIRLAVAAIVLVSPVSAFLTGTPCIFVAVPPLWVDTDRHDDTLRRQQAVPTWSAGPSKRYILQGIYRNIVK